MIHPDSGLIVDPFYLDSASDDDGQFWVTFRSAMKVLGHPIHGFLDQLRLYHTPGVIDRHRGYITLIRGRVGEQHPEIVTAACGVSMYFQARWVAHHCQGKDTPLDLALFLEKLRLMKLREANNFRSKVDSYLESEWVAKKASADVLKETKTRRRATRRASRYLGILMFISQPIHVIIRKYIGVAENLESILDGSRFELPSKAEETREELIERLSAGRSPISPKDRRKLYPREINEIYEARQRRQAAATAERLTNETRFCIVCGTGFKPNPERREALHLQWKCAECVKKRAKAGKFKYCSTCGTPFQRMSFETSTHFKPIKHCPKHRPNPC